MALDPIKPPRRARIGLYSAGLHAYWTQFPGLRDRLVEYGRFIEQALVAWGDVHNFGLVDTEASGREAGEWLQSRNVDIVFCHSATYSTSSTVLPVHQRCNAPAVFLNLQPAARLGYDQTTTGEWLADCGACSVPEYANTFNCAGSDSRRQPPARAARHPRDLVGRRANSHEEGGRTGLERHRGLGPRRVRSSYLARRVVRVPRQHLRRDARLTAT